MIQNVESRLLVPATAKKGDLIEIKTIIMHPMYSGFTKDASGKTVPREIINTFTVTYNGTQVFQMKLQPAISSNPFISFYVTADQSGAFEFAWADDNGAVYKNQAQITVS
ncbi:MAG TPA: thiosulfate oxidation carrier complex protein SoxZ [Candidatus Dormibacteraeota bacterium]|nr:thiosulfate oxidation carrier complex protein SoxZ [Candidatus Dormibacteraeota bacterium]